MKKAPEVKKQKISCELLTLTYGVMVQQIIKDSETILDANKKLEKLYFFIFSGFNIGQRLIDDYLSKNNIKPCANFREISDTIAKVLKINKGAFEVYLGVKCEIIDFQQQNGCSFSLVMQENPLNDFVELTEDLKALEYSNLICGIIRGALNMVFNQQQIQVDSTCKVVKDPLKGDSKTEIFIQMSKLKIEEL